MRVPVTVVIVDESGVVKELCRMDGAPLVSVPRRSDHSADPGGCSGAEDRPITAPETGQAGMAYPSPASPPVSRVRASDADREHVIGVLREAFAEGRLTAEEHSARVGQAYAARTCAELATVSADLPAGLLLAMLLVL